MYLTVLGQRMSKDELEKVMEKKFFCPAKFAQEIEQLVLLNKDMNYIDAIVHFCEQHSLDLESVPKLISKPLKEKIKPEKWLENYFVQETFYAAAYYELTEIPVKKLITIMVTPGGEVKVFDKRNKGDYIKLLVRYIKEFVSNNTGSENA